MISRDPEDPTGRKLVSLDSFLDTCQANQEPRIDMSILQLLASHRAALATDPRDKVYGLLGLVGEEMSLGIEVDYSLSTVDIYVKAATSIIEASNYLDILSVPRPAQANLLLPTWVPDWSAGLHPTLILRRLIHPEIPQDKNFQASGGITSKNYISIQGPFLDVQGWDFDIIEEIGPVMDAKLDDTRNDRNALLRILIRGSSFVTTLSEWRHISRCRPGKLYPNGEDSFEVFLRAMFEAVDDERMSMKQLRRHYRPMRVAGGWSSILQRIFIHRYPLLYNALVGSGFGVLRLLNLAWDLIRGTHDYWYS
jgi:hypothetical protein